MKKFKPYILPAAIVLGLVLHSWAALITWLVPYLIFVILLMNFSSVDLTKLRPGKIDLWGMVFQTVGSAAIYLGILWATGNLDLARGALICVLCPIASSVVVVASALGADRRVTTGYTIYGNILVAVIAPVFFALVGNRPDIPLAQSYWMIFKRIAPVIALPYFVALFMQWRLPRVRDAISRTKEWALVLWAIALTITLGTTIDYIFIYHKTYGATIAWLGVISVITCFVQFAVGKLIGSRYGDRVSGGQLFGQKNTGIGIWMAAQFLGPVPSVSLAFYAIAQNLFNSWQMWRYSRRE